MAGQKRDGAKGEARGLWDSTNPRKGSHVLLAIPVFGNQSSSPAGQEMYPQSRESGPDSFLAWRSAAGSAYVVLCPPASLPQCLIRRNALPGRSRYIVNVFFFFFF